MLVQVTASGEPVMSGYDTVPLNGDRPTALSVEGGLPKEPVKPKAEGKGIDGQPTFDSASMVIILCRQLCKQHGVWRPFFRLLHLPSAGQACSQQMLSSLHLPVEHQRSCTVWITALYLTIKRTLTAGWHCAGELRGCRHSIFLVPLLRGGLCEALHGPCLVLTPASPNVKIG